MKLIHWFLDHPLWMLFTIAVIVRILPAMVRFVIGSDEGLFLTLGQNLAAGHGYTGDGLTTQIDFPPGFSLFAAAIYSLGGGLEWPAKINILVIGSLLPLPVYWLARQLSNTRMALLAGLLTALHPALVLAQGNLESVAEHPYGLLLYTAWGLLWWNLTRRRWWAFGLAGLLIGMAHLVRWEGVIMGLLAAAIMVVVLRRAAVGPVLVFLAGLALFAGPYAVYLYQHTGSILSPKTMLTQLHAAAIDASVEDPYAIEKYFFEPYEVWLANPSQPPEVVRESRTAALHRYAGNIWVEAKLWFSSFSFMTIIWLVPAVLGVLVLGRWPSLFLLPLLIPLAIIPASVVDPRYFLIPLPILMIFTAAGWMWLQEKLPVLPFPLPGRGVGGEGQPRLSLATLLVAATVGLFILADLSGPFLYPRPLEYRAAGLALRQQIPPGAAILARKRQLPFYANGVWVWLPFADLKGVLAYATSHKIDYLVLDQYTTPSLRPQLVDLLDPTNAPASLTPLYVGKAVIVYQINSSVQH